MPRLPQPGGDQGNWGTILNDYLSQAHSPNGSLKPGIITTSNLSQDIQDKLDTVAGQQGPTGPSGPTGVTGPQGPAGASGASGAPGASGTPGAQGPSGTPGAVGATGPTGAPGLQGPTGPSGTPSTIPGPTGATGPSGPAGADGTSVTITGSVSTQANLPNTLTPSDAGKGYITQDDGHLHVWSGTSFTDVGTVRGPSGAIGATGPQGIQGNPGVVGATGATGPSGAPGSVGATGATGPAGNGNVRFYTGSAWQPRGASSFPVTFDAGLTDPVSQPTDWLPGDHIISLNPPIVP